VTTLNTTIVVPNGPSTSISPTPLLYFFPSIQIGKSIIQPVLQWGVSVDGAGHTAGGAYWTMANWYSDSMYTEFLVSDTHYTVSAGTDVSAGFIGTNCSTSGVCSWSVSWQFANCQLPPCPPKHTLTVPPINFSYGNKVQLEAFEAYNDSGCVDLGPDQYASFQNTRVTIPSDTNVAVNQTYSISSAYPVYLLQSPPTSPPCSAYAAGLWGSGTLLEWVD